ncbi:DUF4266 domain-containing protein [Ohtaekwangia sp.]|uniref:DUF4266 domain-containing protein n=1 Tax=Ohtaekwangia sp. TaxID=2066019 RepID=UPI002F926087
MKRVSIRFLFASIYLLLIAACQTVKPYQKVYLNDHEMQPGQQGARRFEESVQVYREGAAGGGSSKSSGGCGCN